MEVFFFDLRLLTLFLVAVSNLFLGLAIFARSRTKSTTFFLAAVFGAALWALGIGLYTRPGITDATYFWSNNNYIAATIISFAYFFFARFFISEHARVKRWVYIASAIAALAVIILIINPGFERSVVEQITEPIPGLKVEEFGWAYPFFVLFISGFFFGGIGIFIKKYRAAEGITRTQIKFILLGTGLAIIFGISTNVLLPSLFNYSGLVWLGPVGTLIMIVFIAYAITKHHLWNLKIIAAELFSALLILTLIFNIFFAGGVLERLLKLGILAIMSAFTFFLIKGLLKEVQTRFYMENLAVNLTDANNKLREIDVEKSDFVSITSHQFRSPLTIIKGYAAMMLEGTFGPVRNKDQILVLEQIYTASQRLVILIEEFLNISRIERNQMTYKFERLDLRELASKAIKEFENIITNRKLKLIFEAPRVENFFIRGDQHKISQVVENIIDNAVKYTSDGGSIHILLQKDKRINNIIFIVQDSGMGITHGVMSRLFEKFSRSENTSKLHTESRGLGLYIAKQVLEAHGGKLWAQSAGKNQGSTFYLAFPDYEYDQRRKEVKNFLDEV